MRKVVLYISMSLDGYIADRFGGVHWLEGDGSNSENSGSYPAFYDTIDTIVLGYRTYHQVVTELSPGSWVYKGKKTYVLTHKKIDANDEIIFTDQNLNALLKSLKGKNGANIWICGGSSVVNQLIALDLIDIYHISVLPTILGDGIPLFQTHSTEHKLTLLSVQSYNGIVDLVYERR